MKKTLTLSSLLLFSTAALAHNPADLQSPTVGENSHTHSFSAASSQPLFTHNVDDRAMEQKHHFVHFWKMAKLAYNPDQESVQSQMPGYQAQIFKAKTGIYDGIESQFGYVFSKISDRKLQIYIATRGTSTLEDALTDGQIEMSTLSPQFHGPQGALVHTGFQNAALSAQKGILSCLATLKKMHGKDVYRTAEISMVGHSLGAAMTLLNSSWLKTHTDWNPNGIQEIVTFGLPSPGNQKLVEHLGKTAEDQSHFYQRLDPVARLKANNTYAFPLKGMALPSQDLTENPTSTHILDGYRLSLDEHYGSKPTPKNNLIATLDHPIINATGVALINTLSHTASEWLKDVDMKKVATDCLKSGIAKIAATGSWIASLGRKILHPTHSS